MKKAVIIYRSKTGTTKKLGERIYDYLQKNGILAHIRSIDEIQNLDFLEYDFFFLGCWTSGLLFFMQRPEKSWIDFAQKLPVLKSERTILFTTYKLRTGSMFSEMRKYLRFADDSGNFYEVKSRNGQLNERILLIINKSLTLNLNE
jgi:flavodoxin